MSRFVNVYYFWTFHVFALRDTLYQHEGIAWSRQLHAHCVRGTHYLRRPQHIMGPHCSFPAFLCPSSRTWSTYIPWVIPSLTTLLSRNYILCPSSKGDFWNRRSNASPKKDTLFCATRFVCTIFTFLRYYLSQFQHFAVALHFSKFANAFAIPRSLKRGWWNDKVEIFNKKQLRTSSVCRRSVLKPEYFYLLAVKSFKE